MVRKRVRAQFCHEMKRRRRHARAIIVSTLLCFAFTIVIFLDDRRPPLNDLAADKFLLAPHGDPRQCDWNIAG